MSTSDPQRPGAAPDGPDEPTPADEPTSAIEETTPGADGAPAHEVAPGVETLDPPAPTEPVGPTASAEPVATTTAATAPVATAPAEPEPVEATPPAEPTETPTAASPVPSLDTGRHAVVRPAPTPPEDPTPDPVVAQETEVAPVVPDDTAATTAVAPVVPAAAPAAATAAPVAASGPPPAPPEPGSARDELFPDPNAPRTTSVGSHILGIIVGLVLAPVAVAVLLIGEAQILDAQVDGWDATTEVLGIVLVTLGLLLLGCILLLALWTPAVPITAGTLLTLAGAVYLYTPSIAREQTLNVLTSSGWRLTVTQVTVAGTSGMVLAVGFLLLLAGLVASSARRRGVHLGEFRERHRV